MGDRSGNCAELIEQNCAANGIAGEQVEVSSEEANLLLARCAVQPLLKPFDAIHLDPFGCCASFLDNAVRAIANGGVLSLTSTDSSALSIADMLESALGTMASSVPQIAGRVGEKQLPVLFSRLWQLLPPGTIAL